MSKDLNLQSDSSIASLKSQYQNLKDNYIQYDGVPVNFVKRGTDSSEYEFERRNSFMNQQTMVQQQRVQQQIYDQATQILQQLSLYQKYILFYYGTQYQTDFQKALGDSQILASIAPFANYQTYYEMFIQFHQFLCQNQKSDQSRDFYIIHLLRYQFYCQYFNQPCQYSLQSKSVHFTQQEIMSVFDIIEYRYLQREIDNQLYSKFIQTYGSMQNYENKINSSQSEDFQQDILFEFQDEYEL